MRNAAALCLITAFLLAGLQPTYGQEENKTEPEKAERTKGPFHAYRVDFAINELEEGKKINSRRYSMNLNSDNWEEIRIGTRVPVATGSNEGSGPVLTQFQYMDVGTHISCRLQERGDEVSLGVRGEFSNFSTAEEQHASQAPLRQPIIRNMTITGSTLAVPGKTAVIGLVDDPNSNREFQLEATVTKMK